uniref:Uncharacterized protein n=1 Tax=Rhizophora mucronata TaxID=61149 RepID=A0A2P2M9P6_RHIMU
MIHVISKFMTSHNSSSPCHRKKKKGKRNNLINSQIENNNS